MNYPPCKMSDFETYDYESMHQMFTDMFGSTCVNQAENYFHRIFEEGRPHRNQLMPHVEELLQFLKSITIKIVIVSNLENIFALKLLRSFDLEKYFDACVFNEDGQNLKPHPNALLQALEKISCPPGKHVWMVGDRLDKDIQCAQAAGCIGIWYDQGSTRSIKSEIQPDAVISTHERLCELVTTTYHREPTLEPKTFDSKMRI